MRARALFVATIAAGCAPTEPPSVAAPSPSTTATTALTVASSDVASPPPSPPPSASAAADPSKPAFAEPEIGALPSVELALGSPDPMPSKPLATPRSIGRGAVIGPPIPSPDRVAIATLDRKGLVVDVRSGKVIAKAPAPPSYVSPRAGVVTLEGKPPRLVRLSDGEVVTPAIDAPGRKLERVWLAASPSRPTVVALAQAEGGDKLAAVGKGNLSTFHLAPVPLDPTHPRYAAVLNAWGGFELSSAASGLPEGSTPFPQPHEAPCRRARIDDDGTIRCIGYAPGAMLSPRWLADGWYTHTGPHEGYFDQYVSHVAWGERLVAFGPRIGKNGHCVARATSASPPRVVVSCHEAKVGAVWAPGKLLTFGGFADGNDIGGLVGADSGPVLPILDGHSAAAPGVESRASRWIALGAPRILTSPKLRPLAIAPFAGVGERALAEAARGEIWLLDFARARRDFVAKIADCPGVLEELQDDHGASRRWLVLACATVPPPNGVAQTLLWAELVNPERRLRWRTPLLPEIVFDDGLVVFSTRKNLAAETAAAPGELSMVDLLAQ